MTTYQSLRWASSRLSKEIFFFLSVLYLVLFQMHDPGPPKARNREGRQSYHPSPLSVLYPATSTQV